MDFHPPGLPRSASVFIRKLHDPLPGSLRLQGDLRAPITWQEALKTKLNQLVVSAARPALGSVPANAQAVIFLDRSELLASLASDWCAGTVMYRWWWKNLLRLEDSDRLVAELWQATPEYVPAALEQLAKMRKATDFTHRLTDVEVNHLSLSIARKFALDQLMAVLERPGSSWFLQRDPGVRRTVHDHIRKRPAPWQSWLREGESAGLRPSQELFLGIALTLQRAPVVARSAEFQQSVRDWQREVQLQLPPEAAWDEFEQHALSKRQVVTDSQRSQEDANQRLINADLAFRQNGTTASGSPSTTDQIFAIGGIFGSKSRASQPAVPQTFAAAETGLLEKEFHSSQQPTLEMPATAAVIRPEATIETQFGGLFYLINLGLYLNLYGDFTTPQSPGIQLSIWDFVGLVGRELVGDQLEADALWLLLRQLAVHQAGEPLGFGFYPEEEWRLPTEWLEPFTPEKTLRWIIADARLRFFHSAGFLVLDVALGEGSHTQQLQAEIDRYDSLGFQVSQEASGSFAQTPAKPYSQLKTSPEIRSWLDHLLPYIHARLRKALGWEKSETLAAEWWRQKASVVVTATLLDINLKLAELPIEFRLAGLDRDPGWVPAAGRFISFHYD
jgi:hypothetical protein